MLYLTSCQEQEYKCLIVNLEDEQTIDIDQLQSQSCYDRDTNGKWEIDSIHLDKISYTGNPSAQCMLILRRPKK